MTSNLPSQSEVEWAEEDCQSLRKRYWRRDNPYCMMFPSVMPEPAMDGQRLHWGENICGLWLYKDYLAINGKWVDMDPRHRQYHPFNGMSDPHARR